ncbi:MAG: Histidine biosynthesis bifunctional protein hisB [Cirrosporium novae-zelandiae]|nr:MAG: Histidine biosynthesis bifunctional protein hisB [Cirrosporium novae-zelandiae]
MLIGVCGAICSGKHSISEYLIKNHNFQPVHLERNSNRALVKHVKRSSTIAPLVYINDSLGEEASFRHVDSLISWVTTRWQQRWVITDIWDEAMLERLLALPFFILVSVESPVSLRWKRFKQRCETLQLEAPTLEQFVIRNDEHLYDPEIGLARLIDRAELRIINAAESVKDFEKSLDDIDFTNEQRIRPSWDQYFMALASLAAQRSNCMKRRVGCVVVRDKRVISTGYNGTPRNVRNCLDGGCPRCNANNGSGVALATCLCIHAEENALIEAGRERIREGAILYCDTIKIVQVGISEVVYSHGYYMDKATAAIFEEAGVKLRQFSPNEMQVTRTVHLLDYVAGNVRSLVNAIEKIGYNVEWIQRPEDVANAEKLILPGVGHYGHCLRQIIDAGYFAPIMKHIAEGKPFMGICVGLQALFEGSEEDPDVNGFGLVPTKLKRFDDSDKSVPHIGWNSALVQGEDYTDQSFWGLRRLSKYYYVHSYAAPYTDETKMVLESQGWTVATAKYGNEMFIGAIGRDNIFATQFHPEKSGRSGLEVLRAFLSGVKTEELVRLSPDPIRNGLTRRVIACMDVRTNDNGDLVVTKGDQYDVREKSSLDTAGQVRNLGKPVELAERYYRQGADEITFLNITSFRNTPINDQPMLEVLRQTSKQVFVPLTIGGGIKEALDSEGRKVSAAEVAKLYFHSGADKVSIGSDAVIAAEEYYASGKKLSGKTAIEDIAKAYGNQAVVVSIDPKRVYVKEPKETTHHCIHTITLGPNGEQYCWYQCTIKGGRESRDLDVRQLVAAVEAMGAGEIMLNCIDKDGTNSGYDIELIRDVKEVCKIPVIASSGAGSPDHFEEVFDETSVDAALGAGIFHRGEYTVKQVKEHLKKKGYLVRWEYI